MDIDIVYAKNGSRLKCSLDHTLREETVGVVLLFSPTDVLITFFFINVYGSEGGRTYNVRSVVCETERGYVIVGVTIPLIEFSLLQMGIVLH